MQGLVHVRLRHGDIVLETPGDRLIHLMDDAQGCVAVLDRLHDNPDCEQVINLIQGLVLVHHFFVNTEKMLHPPVHMGLDPRVLHMLLDLGHDLLHKGLPIALLLRDLLLQIVIDLRLQVFQRQIVQLVLHLGDTEPLSDGRVDVHGLPGLFLLLLRLHVLESAHIVQAVGQLDQNHADILGHGQEHLPQVLRLDLNLVGRIGQLAQLGDAVHQEGHLVAEFLGDLLRGHDRILHRVVEKARHNGLLVELQVRQNDGNAERMDDIRLSRFAKLPLVGRVSDFVRLLNHADIGRRMIFQHAADELFVKHIRTGKILHGLHILVVAIHFHIPVFDANLHLCHCQHLPLP